MTVDGKNAPLVAVWDYGRGRALVMATDASWYWAFTSHKQGSPSRTYDRFWGNALRWLVRAPDLTTLNVTADPPSVEPGKPVGVVVSSRTSDYQPAQDAQVRVELVSVDTQKPVAVQVGQTGPDGVGAAGVRAAGTGPVTSWWPRRRRARRTWARARTRWWCERWARNCRTPRCGRS